MSHFYSNWWNHISCQLTDSVTLPASTALTETGAVHHVAFVVPFSKSLIYFIGQIIHNALVWWWKDMYICTMMHNFITFITNGREKWQISPLSCEKAMQLHSPRPLPTHVQRIMWPRTSWRLSHWSPTRYITPSPVVHTSSLADGNRSTSILVNWRNHFAQTCRSLNSQLSCKKKKTNQTSRLFSQWDKHIESFIEQE